MTDNTEVDEANRRNGISNISSSGLVNESPETEEDYKLELNLWIQRAAGYFFFFILLQFSKIISIQPEFSLVPLLILDFKMIIFSYLVNRQNFVKFLKDKEIIHQMLSFSFKILLIIYNNTHFLSAIIVPLPLLLIFINQVTKKIEKSQECKYLSWLVVSISEFLFFLSIFNLSLNAEHLVLWKPAGLIWPIYIGLCFTSVLLMGLVLFTLGSFMSWLNNEVPLREFISSFWLLGITLGASVIIIIFCLSIADNNLYGIENYIYIITASFLLGFIVITHVFMKYICQWWKSFFTIPEVEVLSVAPRRTLTFRERMTNNIRKAPKMLMRISSSYFKPIDTPKNVQNRRTTSLKENLDVTDIREKKKRFSIEMKREVNSPTANDNGDLFCVMCYERQCDAVIMKCGHGGICYECSLEMWKNRGVCHMCRGEITEVLMVEKAKDRTVRVKSIIEAYYIEEEKK